MKLYQKFINPYMKQYLKSVMIAIFFAVLTMLTSALLTFTSGYLISKASLKPETILLLYVPIVGVRTFGISRAVFQYIERLTSHNAVLKILSTMRVQLYEMIEPQALFIHNRFKTGDLLGTLADDIEHLQDVYIRTVFPTISAIVVFFITNVTLAFFDWKFAIFIALCLGIIVFVYPLLSLYMLKTRQTEQKSWHVKLYESLTDTLFGIKDWMISGKKEQFIQQFLNAQSAKNQIDRSIAFWNQTRTLHLQLLSGIIMISMAIWASIMVQSGEFAPSYIAAFTLVTLPIAEGLLPVSHAVERIPSYKEALIRLDRIERFSSNGQKRSDISSKIPLKNITIELNQLTYRYQNQQENAVNNISLRIQQGQRLAILGKSGAGKSTLIQLLQGSLLPTSGTVSIAGFAPEHFGDSIYDIISVLNQKPYLFATTVENNIRLGNEHASREKIEEIVKQVGLAHYIQSLPNGLDTQMEETGQRFSGGERQRIALARILLKNTPIVVLDEPTIGLDPLTESKLMDTIFDVLKDKTIIWITHHLIKIEKMDHIIFLDHGELTMQGTHDELMRTNKRYQQLFQLDRGKAHV